MRYGLNLVMAILSCTAETEASLNVLSMNVAHVLRAFLRLFSGGAEHCFGRFAALKNAIFWQTSLPAGADSAVR